VTGHGLPGEEPGAPTFLCSVVVPAHDEEAVIADRLGGLVASLPPGAVELVVVANGCTDATADVARRIPGSRVVELVEASKTAALNAGDRAATAFPRIYLDADILISGAALTRLAAALTVPRPVVAAPRVSFDSSGSSWAVRRFFAVFERLPYAGRGLVGLGVYGFSEQARRRFGDFPDVVADDLYVQRMFSDDERISVGDSFVVVAPKDLRRLVAVRTRVARGNRQLAERAAEFGLGNPSTAAGTARQLAGLVIRRPLLLPSALIYLGVTVAARRRARRTPAGAAWERDDSSRTAVPAPPAAPATTGGRP
jgi:glycosyltransferase involved in cell wall biosynthesis